MEATTVTDELNDLIDARDYLEQEISDKQQYVNELIRHGMVEEAEEEENSRLEIVRKLNEAHRRINSLRIGEIAERVGITPEQVAAVIDAYQMSDL